MTSPRPGGSGAALAGIALLILLLAAAASLLLPRYLDRDGPPSDRGAIRVVRQPFADPGPRPAPSAAVAATTMTGAERGEAIVAAMSASFPALRDVAVDCTAGGCALAAVTAVPSGDDATAAYDDMVRTGIDAALRRQGQRLEGPIQIEEIGAEEVRLRGRIVR